MWTNELAINRHVDCDESKRSPILFHHYYVISISSWQTDAAYHHWGNNKERWNGGKYTTKKEGRKRESSRRNTTILATSVRLWELLRGRRDSGRFYVMSMLIMSKYRALKTTDVRNAKAVSVWAAWDFLAALLFKNLSVVIALFGSSSARFYLALSPRWNQLALCSLIPLWLLRRSFWGTGKLLSPLGGRSWVVFPPQLPILRFMLSVHYSKINSKVSHFSRLGAFTARGIPCKLNGGQKESPRNCYSISIFFN